jgi:hypothetical protein
MQLDPGQFVQRCHVTTTTGEQMILAFRLCLEERCQPSYRGFTTGTLWLASCHASQVCHAFNCKAAALIKAELLITRWLLHWGRQMLGVAEHQG